jgi:hypothetical protein
MTRGNQRDIDRARAQKRQEAKGSGEKLPDFQIRKERDAEIMREKQRKALEEGKQEEAKPEQPRKKK